jgi:hypothetical protein
MTFHEELLQSRGALGKSYNVREIGSEAANRGHI